MDITVVLMLAAGILTAAAGFILPQRKDKKMDTRQAEEKIKSFVEQELEQIRNRIDDLAEESGQYAVEKTERALERLTNEKMSAVSEYSDSVLKDIHRNHEEVMFLYDMLNDKQVSLKNTVMEVSKSAKEAEEKARDAKLTAAQIQESMQGVSETVQKAPGADEIFEGMQEQTEPEAEAQQKDKAAKPARRRSTASGRTKKTVQSAAASDEQNAKVQAEDVRIQFAPESGPAQNSNGRILELHKMGKSNMSIAKELGLGIGEVKLVIDLFEGI